jgi:hypothetical protein
MKIFLADYFADLSLVYRCPTEFAGVVLRDNQKVYNLFFEQVKRFDIQGAIYLTSCKKILQFFFFLNSSYYYS